MLPRGRWQALGDYVTLQRGTTYKSRLLGQPGPVLLGLATIQRNGGFREDSLRTYGGESPERLLVQPGALYASLKDVTQSADLLGAVARLPLDHAPGRLTQDTVKLEPKDDKVPLEYLYWMLRTPQCREYCRAHATGTTNLGLSREDFLAFKIPELTSGRQALVEILNALEEKGDLNRRMNETLEAMARAIFKSWFIDADIEGVNSTWMKGNMGDIAQVGRDTINPGAFPEEQFEHYSIPAFDAQRLPATELGSSIRSNKSLVPSQCILLSKLNPRIPRVWLPSVAANGRSICSTEFLVVLSMQGVPIEWLFGLFSSAEFLEKFATFVTGTSGSHQRVKPESLLAMPVRIPPKLLMERFAAGTGPLYARISRNLIEAQFLATTRDTLLPKLLSGELHIPGVGANAKGIA